MKNVKIGLAVLEIIIGIFFLANTASDIQLGFGTVMLFMGINLFFASKLY